MGEPLISSSHEKMRENVAREREFIVDLLKHGNATVAAHKEYIIVLEQLFVMGHPNAKEERKLRNVKSDYGEMKQAIKEIAMAEERVYHDIEQQGDLDKSQRKMALRQMRDLREKGKNVLDMIDNIGQKISKLKERMKKWNLEESLKDPHIFWGMRTIQVWQKGTWKQVTLMYLLLE